jgi:hypothetical protein
MQTSSMDDDNSGYVQKGLGLWSSTSAINSITFMFLNSSTWATGTTATVYGIAAA